MSERNRSLAGFNLDNFISSTAEGGMDDDDWREFARLTIALALAEMREEIRVAVKPEEAPSVPAAPQRRWEIVLAIKHPTDSETVLRSIVIGSHDTESGAYMATELLNSILGSLYVFYVKKVNEV